MVKIINTLGTENEWQVGASSAGLIFTSCLLQQGKWKDCVNNDIHYRHACLIPQNVSDYIETAGFKCVIFIFKTCYSS